MSRAKQLSKLIERNFREEEELAGSDNLGVSTPDAEKELPMDPEHAEAQPEAGEIVEKYMKHPKHMARFMESMEDMMGRYLDDADQDVYSPESEEEKAELVQAKECMKEAYMHMGMKK